MKPNPIFNQDQIDSLVRTACKVIGGILAAHGAQQMATLVNTPDVIQLISGLIVTGIGIYASHTSNAAPVTNTPPANINKPPTGPVADTTKV